MDGILWACDVPPLSFGVPWGDARLDCGVPGCEFERFCGGVVVRGGAEPFT